MIKYPYVPKSKKFKFVKMDNIFMQKAFEAVEILMPSSPPDNVGTPVGVACVIDDEVVATAVNGFVYHLEHGCERRRLNIPASTDYHLCKGCDYSFHAEPSVVRKLVKTGIDFAGADYYVWGHWWCCKPCWEVMLKHDVREVFLLEDSHKYFDYNQQGNKIGDIKYFRDMIK